ncbi:hypothetical protein EPN44_14220 [bacterium]|nr:MAG: hypothetical protein EPN44_14220 [bacterium]
MSALVMPPHHHVRVKLSTRRVAEALERTFRVRGSRELLKVRSSFQLSAPELGQLFGVSRQAIDKWIERGVPTDRVVDVDRVAQVATTLEKIFKRQRLPAIVRGPMRGLDNRSIYDVLKTEGVRPIQGLFHMLGALVPGAEPIRAGESFERKDALTIAAR